MSGARPGWHVVAREEVFHTPYLQVSQEKVTTPTRPEGVHWTVARRPAASVVAPRTKDGKYILIRQERVSVQRDLWEFPAGQIEGEITESSIRETALRELGEETGMESLGELIPLGFFYSSAGFTDECAHLFLATEVEVRAAGSKHDEHEAILEVKAFSREELTEMIASGEVMDANTQVTFARLQARGLF